MSNCHAALFDTPCGYTVVVTDRNATHSDDQLMKLVQRVRQDQPRLEDLLKEYRARRSSYRALRSKNQPMPRTTVTTERTYSH